jgi:predicted RNA-binding Zn ribbon-like protein
MPQTQDWVDGFLFVGKQPALDLLNTELISDGETVELLPDVPALVRWFAAAGLIKAAAARKTFRDPVASERFRRKLLAFRYLLRQAVLDREAGAGPGADFLAELNRLLEKHPTRVRVAWDAGQLKLDRISATAGPDDLWEVIAAATAALFTEIPAARVRKCETCVVHFYDVSKKGARRWCSMNLCGNKVKVAAYQSRRRKANHEID